MNEISPSLRYMRGFSLLELLAASFLGLLVITGILYLYKSQHKSMLVNSSVSELRMNGQYALNEAQYYLMHAGLGLPSGVPDLEFSQGHLVVKMNLSKAGFAAAKHASSTALKTVFKLNDPDEASAFSDVAYLLVRGRTSDAAITEFTTVGGEVRMTIADDESNYGANVTLYPVVRMALRRDAEGNFKVVSESPSDPDGLSALTLAEGIDTLSFQFITKAGVASDTLPVPLRDLEKVSIRVVARTLYQDGKHAGDGYRRQQFATVIGYRRSF